MDVNEQKERHAKWQAFLEEQEKSGLSQTNYCKQQNISVSQFGYYRGLLKSKDRVQAKKPELFSSVQIKNPATKMADEIKIVLPNGFQCYLSASMNAVQMKRLMEVLLSC